MYVYIYIYINMHIYTQKKTISNFKNQEQDTKTKKNTKLIKKDNQVFHTLKLFSSDKTISLLSSNWSLKPLFVLVEL